MKTYTLILTACFLNYLSIAQPGTLDKTFGDTGIVIGNFSAANTSVAVQKDGKYVAAGGSSGASVLARYNRDGSIDASFGKQGIVITNFSSGLSFYNSVAIQEDGKVVAVGQVYDFPYRHIALARYNTDGTLDISFGTNGLVDFSIQKETNVYVTDAAIQSDGKMLITGLAYTDNNDYGYTSFLMKFTTEGIPDKSFGNNGEVFTTFTTPEAISSLAVAINGNIFIGTSESLTSAKFTILKYSPNGFLDSSFGIAGIAKEAEYSSELKTIALQKDGSIVAGGYIYPVDALSTIKLVRFTNKGIVDSSFGKDGVVLTQFEEDAEVDKLLIQNDGKIIGAGTLNPTLENAKFIVVRYLPGGDIDPSFGINGSTITYSKSLLSCTDALLQNDGKILVAGETYTNGNNNFAFARYLNDDKSRKQIIVTKIKKWLQHHNGFIWDYNSTISSYAVQRSYDGIHYSSIAKITAGNNSNYTYADPLPLSGNNYYRLQTTSLSGAVNYSNVLAVGNQSSAISVLPNPATNILRIQGLPSNKIKLTVVDFAGNVAISQQL